MNKYILAIDQGTSSSRSVVFDHDLQTCGNSQQEFEQIYPRPGWVEHDPEAIWNTVSETMVAALADAGVSAADLAAIGITNQRETTLVWDKASGKCIHNAIVWQDRRTADACEALRAAGHEERISAKTGLRLDPYFSATKIAWILDHVDGARERAERGELAFGTVDTFLIWRLTDGARHLTDATNASRTLLFDIHAQQWDEELLALFRIPQAMLPEVRDCCDDFGSATVGEGDAAVPVLGVAGDQQAALIGQAGFESGMTKSTYGTGLFAIANTRDRAIRSGNQLLTTVAMRLQGKVSYGLEGSVFVAGSAIQWLRDEMQLVQTAPESEAVATAIGVVEDVIVVPAFAGLGAPYWDPEARGAVLGLTRGSGREEVITATLQAVAYQTRDLIDAMTDDGLRPNVIRVDGGMAANDWFLQFLADILDIAVERPKNIESTVLGAASLAALGAGLLADLQAVTAGWSLERRFEPAMDSSRRERLLAGWRDAVARVGSCA